MTRYHKRNITKTKKAFTLVELSLAIAFISLLLIIMTTLILSLIAVYRKGITINAVNSVGRSIIEDFQNSVAESQQNQSPEAICKSAYAESSSDYTSCVNDKAKLFIYNDYKTTVSGKNYPRYGVFCTGSYSYVWNTGYALSNDTKYFSVSPIKFSYAGGSKSSNFRLLKILDRNRDVCKATIKDDEYEQANAGDITITANLTDGETISDLIAESDTDLAIYHLYVAAPATNSNTRNAFYSGSFILGTKEGGIDIMQAGNYCKPPGEADENFDYCAINKFNFAVQGNGG